jgi:hypothetical protein
MVKGSVLRHMHAERILIDYEGVNREAEFLVDGDTLHVASKWGRAHHKGGAVAFTRAQNHISRNLGRSAF